MKFARQRLFLIEKVLGRESFDHATSEVMEKWNRLFAETDADETNLTPCKKCGDGRTLLDSYMTGNELCQEYAQAYDPEKSNQLVEYHG